GVTNRSVVSPTQPGTTVQPGTQIQRFQGNPQTNVAPGTTVQPGTQFQRYQGTPQGTQGSTVLRGGATPQPPTGPQRQSPGQVDPRFRGQMGNQTVVPQSQTVVPQGHVVTPQYQQTQPRVVAPQQQQLQHRPVEQDRRTQP